MLLVSPYSQYLAIMTKLMRYALVSDIHSNLQAWNAVLEDIGACEVDHIINLGDIVGYGPNPKEVLNSVCKHCTISVIGNHDAVCAEQIDSSSFNDSAKEVIEWTKGELDETDCQFIRQLPEKIRPEGTDFLVTHAEVVEPLNFSYILTEEQAKENFAACEDTLIFIGHTHQPGVFIQNNMDEVSILPPESFICDFQLRYIINPGSVGDPRSTDITASYCIYDSETREIEFRRVPFDTSAYRRAIDTTDLTARPFFIQHLDSKTSKKSAILTPPANGGADAPQINLSPKIYVAQKRTKKEKRKLKKPSLTTISISMLIAAGALWIFIVQATKKEQPSNNTSSVDNEENITSLTSVQNSANSLSYPIVSDRFPVIARYIKISNSNGEALVFAELEVFSNGTNVALRKTATQSSTRYKNSIASNAIDGNLDGVDNGDLARTAKEESVWWQVDLGREYSIETIRIWNRDAKPPTMMYLDGFHLTLLNGQNQRVYHKTQKVDENRLIEFK